jgi:hypothetical protein
VPGKSDHTSASLPKLDIVTVDGLLCLVYGLLIVSTLDDRRRTGNVSVVRQCIDAIFGHATPQSESCHRSTMLGRRLSKIEHLPPSHRDFNRRRGRIALFRILTHADLRALSKSVVSGGNRKHGLLGIRIGNQFREPARFLGPFPPVLHVSRRSIMPAPCVKDVIRCRRVGSLGSGSSASRCCGVPGAAEISRGASAVVYRTSTCATATRPGRTDNTLAIGH